MYSLTLSLYDSFSCTLVPLASHRDVGRSEEKMKGIKVKYERQLGELRAELKTLKSARREHAKAMKKNVGSVVDLLHVHNGCTRP